MTPLDFIIVYGGKKDAPVVVSIFTYLGLSNSLLTNFSIFEGETCKYCDAVLMQACELLPSIKLRIMAYTGCMKVSKFSFMFFRESLPTSAASISVRPLSCFNTY